MADQASHDNYGPKQIEVYEECTKREFRLPLYQIKRDLGSEAVPRFTVRRVGTHDLEGRRAWTATVSLDNRKDIGPRYR